MNLVPTTLLIVSYLHVAAPFPFEFEYPVAKTTYGKLKGHLRLSKYCRPYYSFRGIPYAKPPVGDLRFKEPQEPDRWNFTRNAIEEPPVCMQRNYLFSENPQTEGQEDCLYLNVYVPQTSHLTAFGASDKLLPVMVFIHWGAFLAGRSTTGYLGPEYFMDKDIVLVTFNYRIGPFGFLSTIDDHAPGNYGLKDQVAALKWVQNNIVHFRGDKHKVTIFGQSAGAGSVHYHLLRPASKGLFHQAISQSGSALSGWALPTNSLQKQVTLAQASMVGCENSSATSKSLISCLRSTPAEKIMESQDNFRTFHGNPLSVFGPVVETLSVNNPNPFLVKTPLQSILNGEITKVPWLTGVVKNEGVLRAASLIRPQQIRKELNNNFEKLVTDTLLILSLSTSKPRNLYKNITEFYLGGKEYIDIDDPMTIQGFINVYSDRAFIYPLYQSIVMHSEQGHTPIYIYSFEYEGVETYGDWFAGTRETIDFDWGTCHCDDLLYLFNSPDLFPQLTHWNDLLLKNTMITLWTNFAKYGNPNPPENTVHANLLWKPLDIDRTNQSGIDSKIELLNITGNSHTGPELRISRGFYKDRIKFWSDSDIFENSRGTR